MAESSNFFRQCLLSFLVLYLQMKDTTGETKIIGIIYYPPIPILYEALCMAPNYVIMEGHYLNVLHLAVMNGSKEETIFTYENFIPANNGTATFNLKSLWKSRFNDKNLYDAVTGKLCFKNITKLETEAQFNWEIITSNSGVNETSHQFHFNITAVEVKQARTEIQSLEVYSIPIKPAIYSNSCFTLSYLLDPNYYVKEFRLQAETELDIETVYTYQRNKENDTGSAICSRNNPWNIDLDTKRSHGSTVCFIYTTPPILNLKYVWKIRIENINNSYDLKFKEVAFSWKKVFVNETDIRSVTYDPPIPILYHKLCMTPDFLIKEGHYLKEIWLKVRNEDKMETIYSFERYTPHSSKYYSGFNHQSFWQFRFDGTVDLSTGKLCFKNITDVETKAQFTWNILSKSRTDQNDILESNIDFNVTTAELKEAGTEIQNLAVYFDPIKPIINEKSCITLSYKIHPGYFIKVVELQAEKMQDIETIYKFQRTGNNEMKSITYNTNLPWSTDLDTQKSNHSAVCFRFTTPNIIDLKYIWKVYIENVNNASDLKSKELSFSFKKVEKRPIENPKVDPQFCNTLMYKIEPGYFMKEIVLEAKTMFGRETVYQFTRNNQNESDSIFHTRLKPWNDVLDTQMSNYSTVCFKTTMPYIINMQYFWRINIVNVSNIYDMKTIEVPFSLNAGFETKTDEETNTIRPQILEVESSSFSSEVITGTIIASVVILIIIIIIIVIICRNKHTLRKLTYYDIVFTSDYE